MYKSVTTGTLAKDAHVPSDPHRLVLLAQTGVRHRLVLWTQHGLRTVYNPRNTLAWWCYGHRLVFITYGHSTDPALCTTQETHRPGGTGVVMDTNLCL